MDISFASELFTSTSIKVLIDSGHGSESHGQGGSEEWPEPQSRYLRGRDLYKG